MSLKTETAMQNSLSIARYQVNVFSLNCEKGYLISMCYVAEEGRRNGEN